jgi:large subunit ribosomal protein L4
LIAQAVRVYRSNLRQATGMAQTRATINRTKRKWYKQKGTGNARHGARSAPIFVGGGVAHGPKRNQHWNLTLTKQMKIKALASALSAQAGVVTVVDQIEKLSGKTKDAATLLKQLELKNEKVLVVLPELIEGTMRSLQNIENVLVVQASLLNTLEVAMADVIIMTSKSLEIIENRLKGAKYAKASASSTKKTKTETKPKTTTKKAE